MLNKAEKEMLDKAEKSQASKLNIEKLIKVPNWLHYMTVSWIRSLVQYLKMYKTQYDM